jgi:hypothetical protein
MSSLLRIIFLLLISAPYIGWIRITNSCVALWSPVIYILMLVDIVI